MFRKSRRRLACVCWALLLMMHSVQAVAAEIKPFLTGSLEQIQTQFQGQRFLLSVWSQDCVPCYQELEIFARLKKEFPEFNLVLVSTDSFELAEQTKAFLVEFELGNEPVDAWAYADHAEKLRYQIDKNWYGEMPRAYFYNEQGARQAVSGLVSEDRLRYWIQQGRY